MNTRLSDDALPISLLGNAASVLGHFQPTFRAWRKMESQGIKVVAERLRSGEGMATYRRGNMQTCCLLRQPKGSN